MITELQFTIEERAAGGPSAETVAAGAKALRAHGCVLLRDVFAADFIAALREELLARHKSFPRQAAPAGSGEVGGKRFLTPLTISGPFHSAQLYANPLVRPILRAVLGPEMVLGALGTVTSLPGAPEQHAHRDGPPLFNQAINRMVTAHAIDLFIPLVEFNDRTGTTRLFPDTHLDLQADPATAAYVDPVIPIGACVLMDYRLFHQGRENRSELIRPLLFAVYHLPWFKDYNNYASTSFLKISDEDYARIPAEHRRLLAWTEHYRSGLY
ncbi:MAG TPA: phytanoyl-CoA dioxygenase family protein [Opitutaceae bacterium]|jgi:hypothetical protein|nr:phytanoyl-CoA dioxygenase family protein [Opitutaceae bacterium]